AAEPAIERRVRPVEHALPAPEPMNILRRFAPEILGITNRALIDLVVRRHESSKLEDRQILPVRTDRIVCPPPCCRNAIAHKAMCAASLECHPEPRRRRRISSFVTRDPSLRSG